MLLLVNNKERDRGVRRIQYIREPKKIALYRDNIFYDVIIMDGVYFALNWAANDHC
jgi:hypothetical protein